jgi:hypothetical protein
MIAICENAFKKVAFCKGRLILGKNFHAPQDETGTSIIGTIAAQGFSRYEKS